MLKNEFMLKLSDLIDEYKAEFFYTNEDDGIHISVFGEECFVGWLVYPSSELRAHAEAEEMREN